MDVSKRILIVDDHPALREGLKTILYAQPNFDIVGEAADGLEALNFVERLLPDLVLMDFSMPRMDGISATREIKKKYPRTKILVLTNNSSPEYLKAALKVGTDGFLSKDSPRAELIQSIKDILDGKQRVLQNIME
jgi:two-component system, NarL family, response regulator NreC